MGCEPCEPPTFASRRAIERGVTLPTDIGLSKDTDIADRHGLPDDACLDAVTAPMSR